MKRIILPLMLFIFILSACQNPEEITISNDIAINIVEITDSSAKFGVTITSDGGSSITARGICFSIKQKPTIVDAKTTDGSGTGSFISQLTDLIPSTVYYVRAYATNSAGTSYGKQVSFTTNYSAPRIYVDSNGGDPKLMLTQSPTHYGALFQFGSVIAWYYGNTGNADYNPSTMGSSAWNDEWKSNAAHTLDNLRQGKGDPCRLVGYPVSEIKAKLNTGNIPDNGIWRTPTNTENNAFATSYSNWTTNEGGKGRFFRTEFDKSGTGGYFLPAAGHHNYGSMYLHINISGHYWSNTSYEDSGYSLYFDSDRVVPQSLSTQAIGCSVRCVRQ